MTTGIDSLSPRTSGGAARVRALVAWATGRPLGVLAAGLAVAAAGRFAMAMISGFVMDDGYYYALLGRNLAAGRGWTFDGVTTTNGAHPLLLAIETALAWLVGPRASNLHYYRWLALALVLVPIGFAAWLPAGARRPVPDDRDQRLGIALALAVGVLFLPPFQMLWWTGMESTLALPLAAAVLLLWAQRRDRLAGWVGAALALARLDTAVFFLLPLATVRFVVDARHAGVRRAVGSAARLLLPTGVFLGAYAVFNLAVFGMAMPIHGALKSSFPHLHVQLFQLFGPPASLGATLQGFQMQGHYLLVAAGVAWLVLRPRAGPAARATGIALLLVYVAAQANYVLFQKWSKAVPYWYLWQPFLAATFGLALAVVGAVSERVVRAMAVALAVALGLTGALDGAHVLVHAIHHRGEPATFWRSETVDYLRTQPADELWASTDCGASSFWSGRRIVDLDGLIAGRELQNAIAQHELAAYLRRLGVRRMLLYAWDRRQVAGREYEPVYRSYVQPRVFAGHYDVFQFQAYSHLYEQYSDTLRLDHQQETWRSAPYHDGRGFARNIAYDLGPARLAAAGAAPLRGAGPRGPSGSRLERRASVR